MRSFDLSIDEKMFNLLWRSLRAREVELASIIEQEPDGSDLAALTANDLVYLRLCKEDLEKRAKERHFSDGAFSVEDGYIDLADM